MKRFKKLTSSILILLMVLVMAVSCSSQGEDTTETPAVTEETQNEETTKESTEATEEAGQASTITDPAGNEITIPEETDTIISLAPSITEVIVDLGFGDNIILVDTNSKDISGLPEDVEYVDMLTPDAEKMIEAEPDIVIASEMTASGGTDPAEQLGAAGITLASIPTSNSIEEIYSDIMFIAQVLSVEEEGQALVDTTKEEITKIAEIGETIEDKKTVYFEIAAAPDLYSFGEGVFLNELIEIIGATNILADEDSWTSVSAETVVAADPDVILTNVNYIDEPIEEIKSRAGWENMKAIQNDDVYYIDTNSSSRSNHNIVKALEEMAEAVYPEEY